MNPTILELRKLPRRFLALEVAATTPVGPAMPAVFRVCGRLGARWGRLAGEVDFRSFLSWRLRRLAAQEVSWFPSAAGRIRRLSGGNWRKQRWSYTERSSEERGFLSLS